jgi:RNA-directed DNA polymerase
MKKASISLQELRRRIYLKAKADETWRFWGLYVHVCKKETIETAYKLVKEKKGAPGVDGLTFKMIEEEGAESFLDKIKEELETETYYPQRNRNVDIPKGNGKTRTLGIPTIKDRVVQGALKLILEPIFEADFQEGSYGYRPKRKAAEAVERVSKAIVTGKTKVIDMDLKAYFDTVGHDILLRKVAQRVNDDKIMRLLKLILKAGGKKGLPQGGVISPLLANLYLNEVDKMLEKAKEVTATEEGYTNIEYARFADDLVVLVSGHWKSQWILKGVIRRLKEEMQKLGVEINTEKTKLVDVTGGKTFKFLGFNFKRIKTRKGKWGVLKIPSQQARNKILQTIKEIFQYGMSRHITEIIKEINMKIRGWVNYFRFGNSSRCFSYIKDWIEKKVRRHMMKVRKRKGFGWKRWSRDLLYNKMGLYNDYKIKYYNSSKVLLTK